MKSLIIIKVRKEYVLWFAKKQEEREIFLYKLTKRSRITNWVTGVSYKSKLILNYGNMCNFDVSLFETRVISF